MVDASVLDFAVLLAVSVAAHMAVAYRFAPPLAVKRMETWLQSDKGQEAISGAVRTHVIPRIDEAMKAMQSIPTADDLAAHFPSVPSVDEFAARFPTFPTLNEIAERFPTLDFSAQMSAWMQSDDGKEWSTAMCSSVVEGVKMTLLSEAGAAARAAQSAGEKLLLGQFSSGNPVVDGLWAALPNADKRRYVRKLYKLFRSADAEALRELVGEDDDRYEEPRTFGGNPYVRR